MTPLPALLLPRSLLCSPAGTLDLEAFKTAMRFQLLYYSQRVLAVQMSHSKEWNREAVPQLFAVKMLMLMVQGLLDREEHGGSLSLQSAIACRRPPEPCFQLQTAHQGMMMKRGSFNPEWKQRFFVLHEGDLRYYKPQDVVEADGRWKTSWRKTAIPQGQLSLQGAVVEPSLADPLQLAVKCCGGAPGSDSRSPASPGKAGGGGGAARTLALKCESEAARNEWYAKLKAASAVATLQAEAPGSARSPRPLPFAGRLPCRQTIVRWPAHFTSRKTCSWRET